MKQGHPALKTVTVSLTNEEWERSLKDVSWVNREEIGRKCKWTLSEKQEFAERVRQGLLNTLIIDGRRFKSEEEEEKRVPACLPELGCPATCIGCVP
jgi:hypothetical protein